ncbi:MAG: hypothetical protein J6J13_00745 [Clostridia bacterium]|nr:hypothetical protein [Clostridia bacterium]
MKRRFVCGIFMLVILSIIAGIGYVKDTIEPTSAQVYRANKIIIDAGHGGLTNTIKV